MFHFQWKDNVTLTESQVQALALSRQASQELDVKRREAMYNDVLTKQQMVRNLSVFDSCIYVGRAMWVSATLTSTISNAGLSVL